MDALGANLSTLGANLGAQVALGVARRRSEGRCCSIWQRFWKSKSPSTSANATVSASAPLVVQTAAAGGNGVSAASPIDPSPAPSLPGRTTPAPTSMSGAASANANDGNADQSPAYRPFVGAPEPATTRIASSSRSTDVGAVHCPAPGSPSDAAMQIPAAAATASAMVDARPSQPPAASGRRSPSRAEPARPAGPPPPPPEPRRPSVPPPAPPVATLDAAATAAIANEVAAAAARQAVQLGGWPGAQRADGSIGVFYLPELRDPREPPSCRQLADD